MEKAIRNVLVITLVLFPIFYLPNTTHPAVFSHMLVVFASSQIILFLYVLSILKREEIVFRRSWLIIVLLIYTLTIFLISIFGVDFSKSFWSSFRRMTGLITILHLLVLSIPLSSMIERHDWLYILRALSISSIITSLLSIFGRFGIGRVLSSNLDMGTLAENSTHAGAYLLIIFFISFITIYLESVNQYTNDKKKKRWKILHISSMVLILLTPMFINFGIFIGEVSVSNLVSNPLLFLGIARTSAFTLYLGLVMVGIIYLSHRYLSKKTTTSVLVGIIFFVLGVTGLTIHSLVSEQGVLYDTYVKIESDDIRPVVWNIGIDGIKERPWIGYGWENFSYLYERSKRVSDIGLDNESFDRVHNFTLSHFVRTGIFGTSTLFILFICIVFVSIRTFLQKGNFYLLIIPIIFILNFIQLQMSFVTGGVLLLSFILFSFLVSHEEPILRDISFRARGWYKLVLFVFIMITITFFIFIPIRDNALVSKIAEARYHNIRMELYNKLDNTQTYSIDTYRSVSGEFVKATLSDVESASDPEVLEIIQDEYNKLIEVFDNQYPKYKDNLRFLTSYANLLNSAFIFHINELDKAEEIAQEALNISDILPQPKWVLSVNAYYRDDLEIARQYISSIEEDFAGLPMTSRISEEIEKASNDPNAPRRAIYISRL